MEEDVVKTEEPKNFVEYESPVLEALGNLGEIIRGDGSAQYDATNGCTSAPGAFDNESVCPP